MEKRGRLKNAPATVSTFEGPVSNPYETWRLKIEIRRLTSADAALLDHVADGVFDEPIDAERVAAYVAEPSHLMLVGLSDGEVVGQVAAVIHRHPDKPTELYIDEVGVAPRLQRQGIARRLLDEISALGRELGCAESWVGTEVDNLPARGLYESRGATAEPFVMFVYRL
jgi:aminoglycoside 6'-N-acetyltransferase I